MHPSGRRGFFVVLEGVEGAGKSTHARRLTARLQSAGIPCRLAREPGGTPVGEQIREVVLNPALSITAEAELLLILAARAEFVRSVLQPALARGEVVVADRYDLSTLAYQGAARGLGVDRVRKLNEFATGGLEPDAVVLLRVDPGEGLRRKSGAADRLEREAGDFHRRVAEAYEELTRELPGLIVVNTGAPRDEVEARIVQALITRWPETFRHA